MRDFTTEGSTNSSVITFSKVNDLSKITFSAVCAPLTRLYYTAQILRHRPNNLFVLYSKNAPKVYWADYLHVVATVCRYNEYISKIPIKFNYIDSLLVCVKSVFIRYSLCTLYYIYKDKENYRTISEVHKTITAGWTVIKSILILHLADVGTVPISGCCEDGKKKREISIN